MIYDASRSVVVHFKKSRFFYLFCINIQHLDPRVCTYPSSVQTIADCKCLKIKKPVLVKMIQILELLMIDTSISSQQDFVSPFPSLFIQKNAGLLNLVSIY